MERFRNIHNITLKKICFLGVSDLEIEELLPFEKEPKDVILVKLTVIRKIFCCLLMKFSCGKLVDACKYLIKSDIVSKLINLLHDDDQHVVFMASKALVSVFLSDLSLASTTNMNRLLTQSLDSQWKAIYTMKIMTQVVNSLKNHESHIEKAIANVEAPCQCPCSSSFLVNPDKNNIRFFISLMIQDINSFISLYIPFLTDIVLEFSQRKEILKGSSENTEMLYKYHTGTCERIREILQEKAILISSKERHIFLSFLCFLSALLNLNISAQKKLSTTKKMSLIQNSPTEPEKNILTLIPLFANVLHIQGLSIEIWSEILILQSNCIMEIDDTYHIFFVILSQDVSSEFLHAVARGMLGNIPLSDCPEGFGGEEYAATDCNIEKYNKMNDSLARQVSLLVAKASIIMMDGKSHGCQQVVFNAINHWISSILCQPNKIKKLFDLFMDQDEDLILIMLLLFQLHNKLFKSNQQHPDKNRIKNIFNPHVIFNEFLENIHFDSSILLDFLVSNETVFLEYLMAYLHLVANDWKAFYHHFQPSLQDHQSDGKEEPDFDNCGCLFNIADAYQSDSDEEISDENTEKNGNYDDIVGHASTVAMGYGNLSDNVTKSGESNICSVNSTSNIEYNHYSSNVNDVNGHFGQSKLDKIMSTLIRLRISLERLLQAELFPYNIKPLLLKMKSIEMSFDGC